MVSISCREHPQYIALIKYKKKDAHKTHALKIMKWKVIATFFYTNFYLIVFSILLSNNSCTLISYSLGFLYI